MRIAEFDYHLPKEAIAQFPYRERDEARLLVVRPFGIFHRSFRDLPELLLPGDLLVFNDSRVIRARLWGKKETGGRVEVLLVEEAEDHIWRCLGRGRLREGMKVVFGGKLQGEIINREGEYLFIRFDPDPEAHGEIPLPPYIRRPVEPDDEIYYQNIFAKKPGSVASPTAGLHFTQELLDRLKEAGIDYTTITCHIRPGIFRRIRRIEDFEMEPEPYEISELAAVKINRAQRVIAVGTSVVRVLESLESGPVTPSKGRVNIFIKPGHKFTRIDGMITNFHLPKSPPFIMVSALVGLKRLKEIYQTALAENYRFLSYGDGMLII
ncbi:tRNA preQ1(34) S-adenosylmethionine ribosyltransferase-isomerase QueA [candidate division WOR-3 bacterium]|uniref:S-adenosylmethionine:tRNA ribosyltransferase-isomerase n=1 Tax=candidate division WOR-3 bacterium TaxID=2052148 RepID=A0A660SJF5_UNCW3|nr:MAG: tRNA preQ1(34) S-adenosylmethionine ribosyltransferase-isomerase QueA [candidate division WOR-3 bacterium]